MRASTASGIAADQPDALEAYSFFLSNLVTAEGRFLVPVLRALVHNFSLDHGHFEMAAAPADMSAVVADNQRDAKAVLDQIQEYSHRILSQLLSLIPSASTCLVPIVLVAFPHRRLPLQPQLRFARNCMKLCDYAPSCRDRVVLGITERLLLMDVEAPTPVLLPSSSHDASLVDLSDKLDALMVDTVEYFNQLAAADSSRLENMFCSLVRAFESCILRTHRCRVVQFVVFHACALRHAFAEDFLRRLLQKAFDRDSSVVERETAAAYVGSFVVRAAFLRQPSALAAFQIMLNWLTVYVDCHQSDDALFRPALVGPLEAPNHAVFYSLCQAVFCVFSYRQAFFASGDVDIHAIEASLSHVMQSPLRPLVFCSSVVTADFRDVAMRCGLFDRSSSLALLAEMSSSALMESQWRLDHFSPFDPHVLPLS